MPIALKHVDKGSILVCGGIHMSDIPSFPYNILWGERVIRSVANLTRLDGNTFLHLATKIPIKTVTTIYSLQRANDALTDLRNGSVTGAVVLVIRYPLEVASH